MCIPSNKTPKHYKTYTAVGRWPWNGQAVTAYPDLDDQVHQNRQLTQFWSARVSSSFSHPISSTCFHTSLQHALPFPTHILLFTFPNWNRYAFLNASMRAAEPTHLTRLDSIIVITLHFGKQYKLWSSLLSPCSSSLLRTCISVCTPFWIARNLRCSEINR
jgi:hypothetical protein